MFEERVAVLGYGSQGRGQALNLRDSGWDVVLGLRPEGASWTKAESDGWEPEEPTTAAASADIVAMLVPDMAQPALFDRIAPQLQPNAMLMFSHGFNIHYGQIQPAEDIDVAMVAPKGPGSLVRRMYENGEGVPCLVAVHQDASGRATDRAKSYAAGIGGVRAGVIETSKFLEKFFGLQLSVSALERISRESSVKYEITA